MTLALSLAGCVPMPVHMTPPVTGRVLDAETGAPVADAVVVVRYDASHGDVLPDRDLLAHREVATDGDGRFAVSRAATPGLSAWPVVRTEARVVGVIKDGYRCASPRGVSESGRVELRLTRATDEESRRTSCRPVAARPDEAPRYLAAWRALYPRDSDPDEGDERRRLARLLEARSVFGPGANCDGPVVDLALSPTGQHVALTLRSGDRHAVEVIELAGAPRRVTRVPVEMTADDPPARRLAWLSAQELVLWEPASVVDATLSASRWTGQGSGRGGAPERVWVGEAPPAHGSSVAGRPTAATHPLEAAMLHDEADSRWNGRSFQLVRTLDPLTGRASESLRVDHPDRDSALLALPGEACGPAGQYGRPYFRISADGGIALDLRHVDGGCRAVAIHLESGEWRRIDGAREPGVCSEVRRVPLAHLQAAARGYLRDLEEALSAAGGDPGASYTLHLERDGETRLESRDLLGERLDLELGPFPIETPLVRIDVTAAANAGQGPAVPEAGPSGASSEPSVSPPASQPKLNPL